MSQTRIIIAGAGWAGLAAGVELSRHNIPVMVVESAKQIGGRARSLTLDGITLDNGQHLMIGAYRQLLELLSIMGVDESSVFHRLPHQIDMRDLHTGLSLFQLTLPRLPAPLSERRCPKRALGRRVATHGVIFPTCYSGAADVGGEQSAPRVVSPPDC